MEHSKDSDTQGLLRYASKSALTFSGSIVAISIALRIVGLDFAPLMHSITLHTAEQIKTSQTSNFIISDLESRIETLEHQVELLKIDSHSAKPEKKEK